MSPPSLRDQLQALASLSGRELKAIPPGDLAIGALQVQLTTSALESRTWAQIARALGHGDAVRAKRDHKRLSTAVRRELASKLTPAAAGAAQRKGY